MIIIRPLTFVNLSNSIHSSSERYSYTSHFPFPIQIFTACAKRFPWPSHFTPLVLLSISQTQFIHREWKMLYTTITSQMADGRSRCAKRFPRPSLDTDSCDTPGWNGLFCTNLKKKHVTFRYFHAKLKTCGKEGIKASASCSSFYHSSIANLCVHEIKRPR